MTYGLEELAALLHRKPAWLRRSWRQLVKEHGFPRPLPGAGLVWSRALVDTWIRSGGVTVARPANANDFDPAPADDDVGRLVSHQSAALAARYGVRPQ